MPDTKPLYPMRINKYLAHKGYATRKEGDALILKGAVFINGEQAVLGDKVEEKDTVEVRSLERKYRYFAYNKPVGIVTHSPQEGEKDIAMATTLKDVFPIGRLDKKSYGLIILTDDGRITNKLLHPDYVHEKEYRVEVREDLPKNFKKRMEGGVDIEGYMTKPCAVFIKDERTFTIVLTEGKRHQIRRMCVALGADVTSLERIRVMNIPLGNLQVGAHRPIVSSELKSLLHALGL